jgi:hypothetical protein
MDATQQFADQKSIPVPKTFLVAGASKVSQILDFFFLMLIVFLFF